MLSCTITLSVPIWPVQLCPVPLSASRPVSSLICSMIILYNILLAMFSSRPFFAVPHIGFLLAAWLVHLSSSLLTPGTHSLSVFRDPKTTSSDGILPQTATFLLLFFFLETCDATVLTFSSLPDSTSGRLSSFLWLSPPVHLLLRCPEQHTCLISHRLNVPCNLPLSLVVIWYKVLTSPLFPPPQPSWPLTPHILSILAYSFSSPPARAGYFVEQCNQL